MHQALFRSQSLLRRLGPASAASAFATWSIMSFSSDKYCDGNKPFGWKCIWKSLDLSHVSCEDSVSKSKVTQQDEDDDPYDNLPDHDEPTTCTICLVNRRGPCRALWRKVEHCLKDHSAPNENVDKASPESSQACNRYMLPWFSCTHDYRQLYLLYFNQVYQEEFIDPMENAIRKDERFGFPESSLVVDWEPWLEYIQDKRLSLAEILCRYQSDNNEASDPENDQQNTKWENPELVEISVSIAVHDTDTGLPVEVAYAKDQTGAVIGFELFSSVKDDRDGESVTEMNDGSSESSPSTHGILRVSLEPERTRFLQIYAVYKQGDEVRLYESKPMIPLLIASQSMFKGESDIESAES